MAISVTKPGKLPENDRMKGTCSNCKAEVECLRGDTEHLSDQRDGDADKIKCPTKGCHNVIWVRQLHS